MIALSARVIRQKKLCMFVCGGRGIRQNLEGDNQCKGSSSNRGVRNPVPVMSHIFCGCSGSVFCKFLTDSTHSYGIFIFFFEKADAGWKESLSIFDCVEEGGERAMLCAIHCRIILVR